ncbi:MAG: gluconate 2-dehydrogenase subunit 3 family protein [Acidobacteria bacterium]|nr:gluconate 2-dehydrogenase subunit 3 family protein [Acidobacteriota bacterium]
MDNLNRRTLLKLLGYAPMAAGFVWTEAEAQQAHHQAQTARQAARKTAAAFKPKFFTSHEYATVRVLVDLIIPRDERSGSAMDAGVPEFMDFMMAVQPARQTAMRGGLAWLDRESVRRADKRFVAVTDAERAAILDEISWPLRAKPGMSHGVAFFNSFRDLTASGFWTSKMGIEDLQYIGNTFVPEWKGCPEEALKKLGLSSPSE